MIPKPTYILTQSRRDKAAENVLLQSRRNKAADKSLYMVPEEDSYMLDQTIIDLSRRGGTQVLDTTMQMLDASRLTLGPEMAS